jgi:hypothetical protein
VTHSPQQSQSTEAHRRGAPAAVHRGAERPLLRGPADRARVLQRIRHRAAAVAARQPSEDTQARLVHQGRPLLAATLARSAAGLRVAANPTTPDQLVLSTLNDLKPFIDQYDASDEAEGDDSDCTRGCDENLQQCLEDWNEINLGHDIDINPPEEEEQDPGSVGGIDDNPLDVENNDPGDTGGTDDDTRDDWQVVDTMAEVSITVLCTVEFMACIAACLIPG